MSANVRDKKRSLVRSLMMFGPKKRAATCLLVSTTTGVALLGAGTALTVAYAFVASGLALIGFLIVDLRRDALRTIRRAPLRTDSQVNLRSSKQARQKDRTKRSAGRREASAPNIRTSSPKTRKVNRLEKALWAGFTTIALTELRALSTSRQAGSATRSKAFLAISKWDARQGDSESALQNAVLARVANPSGAGRKQAALEADLLNRLGRHDEARELIESMQSTWPDDPNAFLRLANTYPSVTDDEVRLGLVNEVFRRGRVAPIARRNPSLPLSLSNLTTTASASPARSSALVSIIMPAYNAERTIAYALQSLLEQTWTNTEIIVVDDASSDGTVGVVRDFVHADSRVKLTRLTEGQGAYAARNAGLDAASGDLVTVHDADDWSHAEKIATQATALLEDENTIGTLTHWVRVSDNLVFAAPVLGPPITSINGNRSSLMVHTRVFDEVGRWDIVRASADTEFLRRLAAYYGESSIKWLHPDLPLSLGLVVNTSLTNSGATGGFSSMSHLLGVRHQYREWQEHWHASENFNGDLPWVPNPESRPFAAPKLLRTSSTTGRREHFDVVMMSNFGLPGGTTASNMQEIEAQTRAGLTTGLLHHPFLDGNALRPLNPKLHEYVDGEQVRFLSGGESVSCDVLVLRFPKTVQHVMDGLPKVEAGRVAVVVNQTPRLAYGGAMAPSYDLPTCAKSVESLFGSGAVWYPIGPRVREVLHRHHEAELENIRLSAEDWLNIIDLPAWRRPARRATDGVTRIGRHSRDHVYKWPADPDVIRAGYPSGPEYEVLVLGGATVPETHLGSLPDNWVVSPFDSVPVRSFLHGLDVYVYYTHSDWVEAFGRAPLEAMAAGVPVVTMRSFEPLFGDAASYCDAVAAPSRIDDLMRDPDAYQAQVKRAYAVVSERFSYEAHIRRLDQVRDGLYRVAATPA